MIKFMYGFICNHFHTLEKEHIPLQFSLDNPAGMGPKWCWITENVGLSKMAFP